MGKVFYKFLPVKEKKEDTPSMQRKRRHLSKFLPEEKAIYEISDKDIEKISGVLADVEGKDLSFGSIFGPSEKRKMIPFDTKTEESSELQGLIDFFDKNGYELDFATGLASKEIEIPAGPKKGQKQKKSIKIGKLIQKYVELSAKAYDAWVGVNSSYGQGKSPEEITKLGKSKEQAEKSVHKLFPNPRIPEFSNDPKALSKFWNEKSEYYRTHPEDIGKEESKYSIVISRHPIDVLRMSDHEGIQSCHSPGDDYYKCAVAEAQGHGLVAYIVNNEDISDDFDLKSDEIFKDKNRKIEGIVPVARLRLRKYVASSSGGDGYEIAAPETNVYGDHIPGFLDTVRKWAREVQPEVKQINLGKKDPPKFKDIERYGGSYSDSADSQVLRLLFGTAGGTEDYTGNVRHIWDDSEEESEEDAAEALAAEYERESERIQRGADTYLEHFSVGHEVDLNGDYAYVYFWGSGRIGLPEKDFIKDFPKDTGVEIDFENEIKDLLSGEIYNLDEVEFEDTPALFDIQLRLSTQDYDPTSDGFDSFYSEVSDYDDEYKKLQKILRNFYIEKGYIASSEYDKASTGIQAIEDAGDEMFENFSVDADDEIIVRNKTPIFIDLKGYDKNYSNQLDKAFAKVDGYFRDAIETAERTNRTTASKQLQIPGTEIKADEKFSPDMNDVEIKIDIVPGKPKGKLKGKVGFRDKQSRSTEGFGKVTIEFKVKDTNSNDDVLSMFAYVKFIDNNFQLAQKMFQTEYSAAVSELGFSPDKKEGKIDVRQEYAKQRNKSSEDTDGFAESEYLPGFEAYLNNTGYGYFDFGRVWFLEEISGGSIDVFKKDDQWDDNSHIASYFMKLFFESFFIDLKRKIKAESPEVQYLIFNLRSLSQGFIGNAESAVPLLQEILDDMGIYKDTLVNNDEELLKQYPELKDHLKYPKTTHVIPLEDIKESKKHNKKQLHETDRDIGRVIDKLISTKKVLDIVKLMQPLDIASVVAVELDLHPLDAARAAVGLIKHNHDVHYEGLAGGSIETNKEFPVPPDRRRKNHVDPEVGIEAGYHKDEGMMAKPQGKIDVTPRHVIPRHHFPPDPRDRPEGWPYDDATVAGMEPRGRGHLRGLTTGPPVRYVFKQAHPFRTDLRLNQPGGDASAGGIYQKSRHSRDNSTPSGGKTWSKQGSPGWSSSPPGKEFDMPDDLRVDEVEDEEEELNMEKNPPVGASRPMLGYGGRDDGSHQVGPRKGFRKR